jgi:hypothetical protein
MYNLAMLFWMLAVELSGWTMEVNTFLFVHWDKKIIKIRIMRPIPIS